MNAEYVSLGALVQNMDIYERMPAPLQGALQESVQRTIQASLISIVVLVLFHFVSPFAVGGFFTIIPITGMAAYQWFSFAYYISGPLIFLNVVSLVIAGIVYLVSSEMQAPVDESIHWLAWVGAIPSAISIVSVAIMVAITAILVVLTAVIWIAAFCIGMIIVVFALMALAGGR